MAAVVSGSRHHLRLGSRHGWKPRLQHETQTMLLHGLLPEPFFRRTVGCMPCHFLGRSSWRQDGILPLPQFRCPVQDRAASNFATDTYAKRRCSSRHPSFASFCTCDSIAKNRVALLLRTLHRLGRPCCLDQGVAASRDGSSWTSQHDFNGHTDGLFFHVACLLTVTGGRLGHQEVCSALELLLQVHRICSHTQSSVFLCRSA